MKLKLALFALFVGLSLNLSARDKLIGGKHDKSSKYNAVVKIWIDRTVCTATKIKANTFLTAAHCVTKVENNKLYAIAYKDKDFHLTNNHSPKKESDFKAVRVKDVAIHPSFIYMHQQYLGMGKNPLQGYDEAFDVAVIKTYSSPRNIPIAPVSFNGVKEGEKLTMVGYGCEDNIVSQGNHPDWKYGRRKIGKVKVFKFKKLLKFVEDQGDNVRYYTYYKERNEKFRIFLKARPKRTLFRRQVAGCPGDSGGPALNKKGEIVGVASTVMYKNKKNIPLMVSETNMKELREWEGFDL